MEFCTCTNTTHTHTPSGTACSLTAWACAIPLRRLKTIVVHDNSNKKPSRDRQASHFSFPWSVPERLKVCAHGWIHPSVDWLLRVKHPPWGGGCADCSGTPSKRGKIFHQIADWRKRLYFFDWRKKNWIFVPSFYELMLLHICYTDQHALQYFDDAWMEMCFSWMAKKDKLTQKYYTDKKESFHFYNGCV